MMIRYKLKKIFVFFMIVLSLSFSILGVNAKENQVNADLISNSKELMIGQKINLTLRLSLNQKDDREINAYKARIVYDENIFKKIAIGDFVSLDGWDKLQYNEETGEFVAINIKSERKSNEVVRISLYVKSNAELKNTSIKIDSIVASTGKKDLFAEKEIINFTFKNKGQGDTIDSSNSNNFSGAEESKTAGLVAIDSNNNHKDSEIKLSKDDNGHDNNIDDANETAKEKNNIIDNTEKSKNNEMKKSNYLLYIIIFIISFLIFLLVLKRFKSGDNKIINKKMLLLFTIGLLSLQVCITVKAAVFDFSNKGELNGDGSINYNDVELLERHLINKIVLSEQFLGNADINSDNNISVTDLSLLIQKIEKTLKYDVEMVEVSSNREYVKKNSNFSLKFGAVASYGAKVEKVKINDSYYNVVADSEEENIYEVKLASSSVAGIVNYKFTEAVLDNGKMVKIDFSETIEVLKEKPEITNYRVNENIMDSSMTISFDVTDEDNAIISSKVEILDEIGNVLSQYQAKKGHNNIKINVEALKKYKVCFNFKYNLTTDKDLDDKGLTGVIDFEKDLQLVIDYNFEIGNFRFYNEENVETSLFAKEDKIKLVFTSDNATKHILKTLKVNGVNYEVKNTKNDYYVIIPGFSNSGTNIINIEEAVLDNGEKFELSEALKVTILKSLPKIHEINIVENEIEELKVDFSIIDKDQALRALVINLADESGKLLEQISLTADELKDTEIISKFFKAQFVDKYKVSVVATYSLANDSENVFEDIVLVEKEIEALAKAEIKEAMSTKKYYEKDENVTLNYKISTNKSNSIAAIVVNGVPCEAKKINDSEYQVNYKLSDESGIKKLKATKIIYSNKSTASVNKTVEVEILKDAPKVTDFKKRFNADDSKMSVDFMIEDVEKSLIEAKVLLLNKNGEIVFSKVAFEGANNFIISIETFELYTIKVIATYDRDLRKDNVNVIDNEILLSKEVIGNIDKVVIDKFSTLKDGKETKYFEKNEKVVSELKTRTDNLNIIEATVNGKKYVVTKHDDCYQVLLDAYSSIGEKTLIIDKIKLDNSVELDVEGKNSAKIEILKNKPQLTNYSVEENINDPSLKIMFDLEDNDNTVNDAILKIVDDNNEIVKDYAIKKGANKFKFSVQEGKDYIAKFDINYNLSVDANATDEKVIGDIKLEKSLRLDIDYKFVANNFKILNSEDKETTIFAKNQKGKLVFDSSNATINNPEKIIINGKEYDIQNENNKFVVILDEFEEFGSKSISIEKISLSNGKTFDIKQNLKITVIKNVPVITDLSVVDKGERVRVDFQIEDEDKALFGMQISLLNDKLEIINQEKLTSEELRMENITKLFSGVYTSTYKVVITANYLLTTDESDKKENVILAEKEIEATAKANILSVTSNKKYYEKGSDVILTYNIETNKTDTISGITIDDKNYVTTKIANNIYQVTYKAPSSCGVKSIKTTNVTFSNTQVAKVDNTLRIEILKDDVSVSKFKQIDNINDSKVTLSFEITDLDDSFINGKAILINRNDGTKIEKVINTGTNSLEFAVKELEMYDFVIKATYDRDSNSLTEDIDNLISEKELLNKEVQLVFDYDLNISDLITSKNNVNTKYFSKNDEITLLFKSENKTNFEIVEATINEHKYDVSKINDFYQIKLNGFATAGVKKLVIEKVKLSNTKEFNINDNNEIQLEVLKSSPTIKDFSYNEDAYGDVTVKFNLFDEENTISNGKVQIIDSNKTIIEEETLNGGNNSIKFTPKENTSYTIKVLANYDLDTNKLDNNSNYFENVVLMENEITLGTRQFQVKDIISSTVYTQTSEGVEELDNVNVSALSNLENFIVKVKPKDMSSFYTTIESYRIVDNRLKLTLKYDDIVQYDGNKKINKLEVDAGKVNNGTIMDDSLDNLVKKINANPSGNFELTRDYDASLISPNLSTAVSEKFTGTLNGNGYKITNLAKPFFNELEGATIKNIVFNDVKLSGANSRGTVANIAVDTTVTNVHIKGLNYTTGANHSAGMIGEATNTNVSECSVTDFVITTAGHVRVSAIIGKLTDGLIKNCYAEGDINSTQSKDGNGIGGVLGHGYGVETVENCITKIKISNNVGARLNGAVVGLFMNKASVLKNNVSLSTGENFYSIYGNGATVTATNNYELADSGLVSNVAILKFSSINKNQVNSIFYKNEAKFDDAIWDLIGTSYDKLPRLKNSDPNGSSTSSSSDSTSVYIPDYNRVKKVAGYKKSNEKLYHNIYKLMPYYDAKYLIEDSLKIANDNVLATKVINHILPYSEGKLLTYVTVENYNTITDIKVVFNDMTVSNYKVNFKELNQNISIYEIEELGIDYAPNSYLMRNDAAIVNVLKAYIDGVDYNTTLEPLTEAADARHYRDNFNGVVKGISLELSLKLLANYEDALTINSEILNNKIKADLIDSGKINKIIYGYNYFNRWYDFDIAGSKVSDLLLFENKMFKEDNSLDHIVDEVLVGNIAVGATDGFFNSNVAKYTGSSRLQYFLDYLITNIGGYEDVNDWFTEYFGSRNFLAEFGVDNRPELLYRGWYQLKKSSRMILPVITMPRDSTYMISGPAHLQFGPAQLYNKDTVTDAGKKVVRNVINNHVTLVKRHFTVLAAGFGSLKWNNYCIMCYDCTKIITGYRESTITIGGVTIPTGKIVPVYTQGRVGLNYAFFKNFSEVLGLWQPAGSSGGVGNSAGFLWFQAQPGLTNYDTWTHEFEHALYDKIMLDQRGFRTRMEIMTQGNIEQRDDWSINNLNQDVGPYYFNTSFYLNKEGNATQNLSPDRIDTKEEMENYFKGQQNALDLLDYIEGKAFIKLTPEQQAKIATRVASASERTAWGTITTEQASQMNLTSLESLYDNQIILRPPNAWGASVRGLVMPGSTVADNYGYESVWVNRWYIDHYDSRFAGAFGTKRNLFEMLGYAGVEGYIIYGSGRSGNDLDAIRKITQLVTGTTMNWREYKMSRYATVEENLNNNKYIDAEYMIQRFTEALVNDANNGDRNVSQRTNLRKIYYHYLKSATNDFIDDPLGSTVEVNHIKTADELVQKINAKPYGYYVLDNDIDFSNMTKNVTQTFMGRLDGNGHKIIGNKFPIFNKIRYGYVGNIEFKDTNIPKNISNAGALSYRSEMSTIEKINVRNLQMNFAGRNDLSLIGGAVSNVVTRDCTVEKLTHHISSVDDIAMLNEDTSGIFIIDNDIDFTGKTYNGSVVTNIFTGKIDGNGHTISNLENASLFNSFRGVVENLNIRDFSNTSAGRGNGDFVTAFTQESYTATFRNMKFENITLSGRNNVAVVSGADARDNANSIFENISVKNANVTGTGVYVSNFVGRKYGGRISNVFVQGKLTINSTENGGLVGSLQQNGTVVENVITDVDITKTHNTYGNASLAEINGSMFGNIYNTPIIRNSIAFGNMSGYTNNAGIELKPYKFAGAVETQIIATMTNCYEILEEIGSTRVSANTQGKLSSVARASLNKEFYKNLGFDESVWNLDNLSSKGYPTLK